MSEENASGTILSDSQPMFYSYITQDYKGIALGLTDPHLVEMENGKTLCCASISRSLARKLAYRILQLTEDLPE